MANFNSTLANILATTPPPRTKPSQQGGRIRLFESVYVSPAASPPQIADKIIWGKLPVRARVMLNLGYMQWTTGTASCTLNLGDNVVPARHSVAVAITTAGGSVIQPIGTPFALLAKTCTGDIVIGSNTITNLKSPGALTAGDVISVGAGIAGFTVLSVNGTTAVLSAVSTATTNTLAISVLGANFETSDDSANAANSFTSATDDCTLISTVAGAQIAVNQVIKLVLPYVQD